MIKLLPWPNPRWKENPYQLLLYGALEKHDIKILKPPLFFSHLPYWRKADWLHLNWPDRLFDDFDHIRRARLFERTVSTIIKIKKRKTKLVWTLHNELPHDTNSAEFFEDVNRRLFTLCDLVHVHFPAARHLLESKYKLSADKIIEVSHGHFDGYYGHKRARRESRKSLQLPDDATVLLNFGNLKGYKGIQEAVSAFEKCAERHMYFVIAGKPATINIRKYLFEAARRNNKIRLYLEKIEDEDIVDFFCAADVFVFPSKLFFTSGSIMLALTYELPFMAILKNHTEQFRGKSYFYQLQSADYHELEKTFGKIDMWLEQIDYQEMAKDKKAFSWEQLAGTLAERLKNQSV